MDIVADVLNQADAAKLKVATRHIEGLARGKAAKLSRDQFQLATGTDKVGEAMLSKEAKFKKDQSRVPGSNEDGLDLPTNTREASKKAAMRGLETILATKMVEGMMPKDQSRLYGEGTAGEIWRGFHIEVMGKALAGQGLFATSKDDRKSADQQNEAPKKIRSIVPFAG